MAPRVQKKRRIVRPGRSKQCLFCKEKIYFLYYKDTTRLRKLVNDRGKILPRRSTGTCAKHQRMVTRAIKRSRIVALLPFVAR
jgi:small subunit ribosomal protein S18